MKNPSADILWGDQLVIGSHGKKPAEEWVKVLDSNYGLASVDWSQRYRRMRWAWAGTAT